MFGDIHDFIESNVILLNLFQIKKQKIFVSGWVLIDENEWMNFRINSSY